jgi:DNA-binding MarR family transcriptional regulator
MSQVLELEECQSVAHEPGPADLQSAAEPADAKNASETNPIFALAHTPIFPFLKPSAVKVLIAFHGRPGTKEATAKDIAAWAGVSKSSVRSALKNLEENDLLTFCANRGDGYKWSLKSLPSEISSQVYDRRERAATKEEERLEKRILALEEEKREVKERLQRLKEATLSQTELAFFSERSIGLFGRK